MQGAQAGFSVGGPMGAIIGGIAGGIGGLIGGHAADAGKFYERKANKWAKLGKTRTAAIAVRDAVEQFRQQRAIQMATIGAETGGNRSSAPAGAISSLGSQFVFAMAFNQGQNMIQEKVQKNLKKAGKSYQQSQNIMAGISAISSSISSFGGIMGGSSGGGNTFGIGSPPANSAVSSPQAFRSGTGPA
jgi:hypothetical protein